MQIGRVLGATRVVGMGLPIRDETVQSCVGEGAVNVMVTAWLPTPKELEALNAGAPVHVRVYGTMHPPIIVETGEAPE